MISIMKRFAGMLIAAMLVVMSGCGSSIFSSTQVRRIGFKQPLVLSDVITQLPEHVYIRRLNIRMPSQSRTAEAELALTEDTQSADFIVEQYTIARTKNANAVSRLLGGVSSPNSS